MWLFLMKICISNIIKDNEGWKDVKNTLQVFHSCWTSHIVQRVYFLPYCFTRIQRRYTCSELTNTVLHGPQKLSQCSSQLGQGLDCRRTVVQFPEDARGFLYSKESRRKVRPLQRFMQRLQNILSLGAISRRTELSTQFFIQYGAWKPESQVLSPWGAPGQNLL